MKYLEGHPYVDLDEMGTPSLTLSKDDDVVGPDVREPMTLEELQAAVIIDPDDAIRAWIETHEITFS